MRERGLRMSFFCYFAHFRRVGNDHFPLEPEDLRRVAEVLARVDGLSRALVHTPAPAGTAHPFPRDEPPPLLALQLYADRIEALEAALRPAGALQALGSQGEVAGLRGTKLQQQAMLVRRFPVGAAGAATVAPAESCSYLVHYPGHAENLNAWLQHYLDHHPQIMGSFPGIREIEVCTRVDWVGGLPGMRVNYMQRNKQVFDSPSDLSAGLLSPVIRTMRADFHSFPDFAGGNVHYPMLTRAIELRCASEAR